MPNHPPCSDGEGELGVGCGEPVSGVGIKAKLVMRVERSRLGRASATVGT